jgi:hypothetical protein
MIKNISDWNLTDGSKSATFTDYYGVLEIRNEEKPTSVVLKEKISSDCIALRMPTNFYLFKAINEKITQMIESGIMEKILGKETEKSAVALSIDHLLIWFKLWGGFLLVASAAFVGEILTRKFLCLIRKRCC